MAENPSVESMLIEVITSLRDLALSLSAENRLLRNEAAVKHVVQPSEEDFGPAVYGQTLSDLVAQARGIKKQGADQVTAALSGGMEDGRA